MNRLSGEKQEMILSLLVEGNSIRGIERLTGVHRDTIMRLMISVGENCRYYMEQRFQNLRCQNIECDELWTFVGKKQRRVKPTDNLKELGDQYIFVALDRDTKLVPLFIIGKRTSYTAYWFMWKLRRQIKGNFQLTTDRFRGYLDAVPWTFGTVLDYATLQKYYYGQDKGKREGYSPTYLVGTEKSIISGNPDLDKISTSYVERQNLTMRTNLKRLTRLTIAFSKKLTNLRAAIALHFWYYNFMRPHKTLKMTPAMASGISTTFLSWNEVL